MWAPRPWDQGNWVHMVGVRAPLPPQKQRPPPRQAVLDRETNPSWSLLWFTGKAYSVTRTLYVFIFYFFCWPADWTMSWQPCACLCSVHLPSSLSVLLSIYNVPPAHHTHIHKKRADCREHLSNISNIQQCCIYSHFSPGLAVSAFRVTNPVARFVASPDSLKRHSWSAAKSQIFYCSDPLSLCLVCLPVYLRVCSSWMLFLLTTHLEDLSLFDSV